MRELASISSVRWWWWHIHFHYLIADMYTLQLSGTSLVMGAEPPHPCKSARAVSAAADSNAEGTESV